MSAEETPRGAEGATPGGEEETPAGDAIIGATLEGLRRAAAEVEHVAALAETLQRSLLPEHLPQIAGLGLAARYVAGSADAQVGGDWYDVIPLRDGRTGLAIGDVVGHGLDAAAKMAALQNALRAYALDGLRPSLVLERMNGFARELQGGPMATLLYAVVDPDAAQMRMASAAHPPPLVADPTGAVEYAEGPTGSPLGVVPFPTYDESVVALADGSTILLYTDGLVERPEESLDQGLEWLRGFVRAASVDPEELCAALLKARFPSEPPRDDVALLAVHLEPLPEARIELTLSAEPESLALMRRALGRWLRAAGASDAETYELLVACGEACSNAIAHAYPPGEASYAVVAHRRDGGIEIDVRDYGSWRKPRAGSVGRGLKLITELIDDVEIDRGRSGTEVRMFRRLAGAD